MKATNHHNTILITGGHFTAAIAVYSVLHERGYDHISWIGHKYTMLHDKETSSEYKEVTKHGIPFYDLKAGKLYRYLSWIGLVSLLRIPLGYLQAIYLLFIIKPKIILSFGGYLAVPVTFAAWLLGIPVITHEQTATFGLSNKIISFFAKKVLITWDSSFPHFPKEKTVVVGNPIRKEIYVHDKPFIDFQNTLPTILVMGGNQGSHLLNTHIKNLIPKLSKQCNILHQTGSNTIYDDFTKCEPLMKEFPNYAVFKGVWGDDIGRAFSQSSLYVGRSGANTVYEIASLAKPSIFIPLAYAVHNEQYENARILKDIGLAEILEEKDLTDESLLSAILSWCDLEKNPEFLTTIRPRSLALIREDATSRVADYIDKYI